MHVKLPVPKFIIHTSQTLPVQTIIIHASTILQSRYNDTQIAINNTSSIPYKVKNHNIQLRRGLSKYGTNRIPPRQAL